jgi:hypothetical protein
MQVIIFLNLRRSLDRRGDGACGLVSQFDYSHMFVLPHGQVRGREATEPSSRHCDRHLIKFPNCEEFSLLWLWAPKSLPRRRPSAKCYRTWSSPSTSQHHSTTSQHSTAHRSTYCCCVLFACSCCACARSAKW